VSIVEIVTVYGPEPLREMIHFSIYRRTKPFGSLSLEVFYHTAKRPCVKK
jgi:hypothetical protein